MASDLIDPEYLPFTEEQLLEHFCLVNGGTNLDPHRHLKHFRSSMKRAREYADMIEAGTSVTPSDRRWGRQVEKDEKFWCAAALMALYHTNDGCDRVGLFADLLRRAQLDLLPDYGSWEDALAGDLRLYFEVALPSPVTYRDKLRTRVDERVLVPYLRNQVTKPRWRGENWTAVDALLLAPDQQVAIAFEAKVLSDISHSVTYDVLRNQIARSIDVLIEEPRQDAGELGSRRPDRSCLVLLTPELFRSQARDGGRLYSWLMHAYRDPSSDLLVRHLDHRASSVVTAAARRLGWATWQDFCNVLPNACLWLGS